MEKSIIIAQTKSIGVELYSTSMEKDIEDAENASNNKVILHRQILLYEISKLKKMLCSLKLTDSVQCMFRHDVPATLRP